MPTKVTHQPIRILHLSDVHFRVGKGWDADPVTRALARFIKSEVEEGLPPDLVVFSGDLAFSGKAGEYKLAREWLEGQLWPALPRGLRRDRLLLVPGNHDVDRSKVDFIAEAVQGRLLATTNQSKIAEVLADAAQRDIVLRRHADYMDFVAGWYGKPQPLPWWERLIKIRGVQLHFAGLDSAWMSCGDEDRNHLLLGRYQLTQTVETRQAEDADWRIVLVHHPWDYLAEFESHDARATVHQHRDLLLRGHLHRPLSERVLPPDPLRQCLELATGCVYDGSQYPNAFQWIELSPATKNVRVRFRAWLHNEWTVDHNQPGGRKGYADFKLGAPPAPTRVAGRSAKRVLGQSKAPEIPPEYLRWLEARCAGVELVGQDVQQSLAIKLSQVYVPALTSTVIRIRDAITRKLQAFPGSVVPLLQRVDEGSLYLPAPAGAGKSTFCRWAALQSIPDTVASHPVAAPEEYPEPVPAALRTRLPLLVPLREFDRHMDCGRGSLTWHRSDLEEALAAWVDRSSLPGLSGALLRDHLKAGSSFLLLDGVDEVAVTELRDGATVYPRKLLLSGLVDALPTWKKAGNRILLTSRPYGLDEAGLARLDLPRAPLEPLPKPLQELFVRRWFHTLRREELTGDLLEAVRDRDDLAPLTENPMLLTAMCVLYDKGGRLPEDRYELYKSIVDNVLHGRYPGDAREREPVLRRLEAIAYGMHTGEPGEAPRQAPAAEISWNETERLLAHFAEKNPSLGQGEVAAAVQRDDLLTRSGLLLPRPNERAAFYHLTFQEFLAAQRIARGSEKRVTEIIDARVAVSEWRATLLFLFAAQIFNKDPEWGLDLLMRLIDSQDRAAVKANPTPAVFVAEALELCLAKGYRVPDALADGFRGLALHAIDDEIEVEARQALGLCLGRLGDPRIFDLRDPRAYVEVPVGTYPYGEKGKTVEITAPFCIGRYPVTNSQYRAFLDDGGYSNRDWWSDAGWDWIPNQVATESRFWRDRRWNGPNQPVVGVSFFEAEACCSWAGGRLPQEQEWEAVARGPDGCEYPWCSPWRDGICNIEGTGLYATSPVGLFPRSRQAQLGIEDLAGNVWEWCATLYDDPDSAAPEKNPDAPRVVRGGSWVNLRRNARSAARNCDDPDNRDDCVGFRVVCSSPITNR